MKILQRRGPGFLVRDALAGFLVGPDGGLDIHNSSVPMVAATSTRETGRQRFIAFDEAGIHPLGFPDHLYMAEALHDFFPNDLQLQFGKPDSDAAVNAEAERD